MAENENPVEELTPTPEEILEDLKANTIPKEEYDKLLSRYNKLFYDVANDRRTEEAEKTSKRDLAAAAIRGIQKKELHTPLEHIDALLKVDDFMLENGQRSIFLPSEGEPNEATVESANKVRELLKKVKLQSEGSNEVATALIGNSLRDVK